MKIKFIILSIILIACSEEPDRMNMILSNGSERFQQVLNEPRHEVQIIYGEILSDTIIHHSFGKNQYFYPASSVKMLAAFAAAKRAQELDIALGSVISIDSSKHNPREIKYDSLFNEPISINNLISKIFVYSDNQAYNILYGWLGKKYLNQVHKDIGLDTRVIHQLSESAFAFSDSSNMYTFRSELKDTLKSIVQEPSFQSWKHDSDLNQSKGIGYIDEDGELVNQPFDFSVKNLAPLTSLLGALERIVKPGFFDKGSTYNLSKPWDSLIVASMKLRPKELPAPIDTLPDNYVKFLMYGDSESCCPTHIEIMNKVGWAYGYLTDVAYISDTKNNIEFFLAATIQVNENQIFNDGVYEYEEVGLPFLAELGRLVYDHEISKSKY